MCFPFPHGNGATSRATQTLGLTEVGCDTLTNCPDQLTTHLVDLELGDLRLRSHVPDLNVT